MSSRITAYTSRLHRPTSVPTRYILKAQRAYESIRADSSRPRNRFSQRENPPTGRTNGPTYHSGFRPIVYDNLLGQFIPTRGSQTHRTYRTNRTYLLTTAASAPLYHPLKPSGAGPFGTAAARHDLSADDREQKKELISQETNSLQIANKMEAQRSKTGTRNHQCLQHKGTLTPVAVGSIRWSNSNNRDT
eukprot:jgi/Psemu1/50740/gm1.50740_g